LANGECHLYDNQGNFAVSRYEISSLSILICFF